MCRSEVPLDKTGSLEGDGKSPTQYPTNPLSLGPVAWKLAQFQHAFQLPFVSAEPPKLCVHKMHPTKKKGSWWTSHLCSHACFCYILPSHNRNYIRPLGWFPPHFQITCCFFLREWGDQIVCNLEENLSSSISLNAGGWFRLWKGNPTKSEPTKQKKRTLHWHHTKKKNKKKREPLNSSINPWNTSFSWIIKKTLSPPIKKNEKFRSCQTPDLKGPPTGRAPVVGPSPSFALHERLVTPSRQHRWALGGRACAVGCHGSPLGGAEKNGNLHVQLQEFEAQQKEFQIRSYPQKKYLKMVKIWATRSLHFSGERDCRNQQNWMLTKA